MGFERGDRVEITNNEEGFKGSYFTANIISQISTTTYIIQYKTLLNNNRSTPLRELLPATRIRPQPPEILATGFSLHEVVDAYDNDGWWKGKVIKKMGDSKFLVYFEYADEKKWYGLELLRVHQDWKDGCWVYSKR